MSIFFNILSSVSRQINSEPNRYIPKPLPVNPDVLQVLAIGNSFTMDLLDFMPNIFNILGITNVRLNYLYRGGTPMEYYRSKWEGGLDTTSYYKLDPGATSWVNVSVGGGSVISIVDYYDWDAVIFHDASAQPKEYSYFKEDLDWLIREIRILKPDVKIGFQQVWAYSSNYTGINFEKYNYDQITMYNAIIQGIKDMRNGSEVDFIIPTGTTIQNLRTTSIGSTALEMTRDGFHLNKRSGRYAASCTFFESVIKPVFGISISQDTSFIDTSGDLPVNDTTRPILQDAAIKSVANPYEITAIPE